MESIHLSLSSILFKRHHTTSSQRVMDALCVKANSLKHEEILLDLLGLSSHVSQQTEKKTSFLNLWILNSFEVSTSV
eukprot:scaffold3715_cov60-Cyclotella_meneghiniana.AAC.2